MSVTFRNAYFKAFLRQPVVDSGVSNVFTAPVKSPFPGLNEDVFLKIQKNDGHLETYQRFYQQVNACIPHNTSTLYHIEHDAQHIALWSRHIRGLTLEAWYKQKQRTPPLTALVGHYQHAYDLLTRLRKQQNIILIDRRPANLMLEQNRVMLIDFSKSNIIRVVNPHQTTSQEAYTCLTRLLKGSAHLPGLHLKMKLYAQANHPRTQALLSDISTLAKTDPKNPLPSTIATRLERFFDTFLKRSLAHELGLFYLLTPKMVGQKDFMADFFHLKGVAKKKAAAALPNPLHRLYWGHLLPGYKQSSILHWGYEVLQTLAMKLMLRRLFP
jgi:hypothetical protein